MGGEIYALTEDGILWQRVGADDWRAINGPGDGTPFKPEMTEERLLKRLAAGAGFPKESK